MPFGPPPIPSGADLSSLSLEQLRVVEAQERQNVESRVAMLRAVHSLLDAAISQLNQYNQMVDAQKYVCTMIKVRNCDQGVTSATEKWLIYMYDASTSISHVWTGTTQAQLAQAQEKGTRYFFLCLHRRGSHMAYAPQKINIKSV